MTRLFSLLTIGLLSLGLQAQTPGGEWGVSKADSIKCWENYNIFGSLYNSGSYVQAYDHWNIVYTLCPGAKEAVYVYGPKVVESKIKATTDTAELKVLKAQLIEMYDNRLKYFPGKEAYVKAAKALQLYEYFPDNKQMIFDIFEEALSIDASEMSAAQINAYFMVAVKLYQEKELELPQLFDMYNKIAESVARNAEELNIEAAELRAKRDSGIISSKESRSLHIDTIMLSNYEKVKNNIDIALRPILSSCDKIALVYNAETFAANKDNEVWLRRAVRTLGAEFENEGGEIESCSDNPLYFEMTEALYALNPSTEAARNMGRLAYSRNDYNKATQYFNEAIAGEGDPKVKAKDYLRLALVQQKTGQMAAAKNSLLKAGSLDRSSGEAYLQLATLYASAAGSCGENVFEKNAVYWAAIAKAELARQIEPALAGKANQLIASYRTRLPGKSVSFQLGYKEGDVYTIGCWINETITVRYYE